MTLGWIRQWRLNLQRLDLRAKITFVILAALIPTFVLIVFVAQLWVEPLLLSEIRQIGTQIGATVAGEIANQKLFHRSDKEKIIETRLRELIYLQPNVTRLDVYEWDPHSNGNLLIASTVEEEITHRNVPMIEEVASRVLNEDIDSESGYEFLIPIKQGNTRTAKTVGAVRLVMSVQLIARVVQSLSRVALFGGVIALLLLFVILNVALRRTIDADRKLREAVDRNLELSEQLHETERSLMNVEKLAVMGQLTASFAHEIGTPLNALGGHLSLLREEAAALGTSARDRIDILEGQVAKIAEIVRSFLQNTAKPDSQKQLIDPNRVVDKTLSVVRPRAESYHIDLERELDRDLGPIRIVPMDLEQILLNLLNNSLDSLKAKNTKSASRALIRMETSVERTLKDEHLVIRVKDTGEGIAHADLGKVLKPFYTTKAPGEGTGLGLTICQELAKKYGGWIEINSDQGNWTEVQVKLPYRGA